MVSPLKMIIFHSFVNVYQRVNIDEQLSCGPLSRPVSGHRTPRRNAETKAGALTGNIQR